MGVSLIPWIQLVGRSLARCFLACALTRALSASTHRRTHTRAAGLPASIPGSEMIVGESLGICTRERVGTLCLVNWPGAGPGHIAESDECSGDQSTAKAELVPFTNVRPLLAIHGWSRQCTSGWEISRQPRTPMKRQETPSDARALRAIDYDPSIFAPRG
jgi:hypothetical protein